MAPDRRAAFRSWMSFEGAGPVTRAFLMARISILPLGAIDDDLRSLRGRVLSMGPGHGLVERYLAEINPDVTVVGVDLDEGRVRLAGRSAHRYPSVEIRYADARHFSEQGDFDAALLVDMLHHVALDERIDVAKAVAGALRPGGTCLIKDMDTHPAWKCRWNQLHDRIVSGEWVQCHPPEEMVALFEAGGLVAESVERVHRPYGPYAHYVVRLRKPTA